MPYSSVSELPEYVKTLPDNRQRQWMHVFGSGLKDGKDEATCAKLANGVVKKELGDDWELNSEQEAAEGDELEQAVKSYQYVETWDYEQRKLSQEEAGYNPVGGGHSKACSNCKFFVSPARCTVVSGEIAPNGVSSQWRAVPVFEPVPIPVIIVKSTAKQGNPVTSLFNKLRGVADKPVTESLQIVRQKDGSLRWFARYSNAWEDLDSEIITEAAHKEYVEWATTNQAYPELWLWHTPGTRFGVADWLDFSDGFASASGIIDAGKEHVVDALKAAGDLGVSHGFLQAKSGKYINKYRTFEITVLPMKRAAVWTTNFSVAGKEAMMAFSKDSRDFLIKTMGEDWVKSQEADQKEQADRLRALGTAYKSTAEREEEAAAEAAKAKETPVGQVQVGLTEELSTAFKGVAGQISDLAGQLTALTSAVTAVKSDVDTLKKTDKERIDEAAAEVFKTRAAAPATRPTEDPNNVLALAGKATKDSNPQMAGDQWLFDMVKSMNFGGDVAPSGGVGAPAAAAVSVNGAAGE